MRATQKRIKKLYHTSPQASSREIMHALNMKKPTRSFYENLVLVQARLRGDLPSQSMTKGRVKVERTGSQVKVTRVIASLEREDE